MKTFTLNSLPKDVKEKLEDIQFDFDDYYDDGVIGLANLKDGWLVDDSHIIPFSSKSELISIVRNELEEEIL